MCFWNIAQEAHSAVVEDVITLVEGGSTVSSSGVLVIRDPDTYRKWGATLKYDPTLIDYEVSYWIQVLFDIILFQNIKADDLLPRPCRSMSWCAAAQPPTMLGPDWPICRGAGRSISSSSTPVAAPPASTTGSLCSAVPPAAASASQATWARRVKRLSEQVRLRSKE